MKILCLTHNFPKYNGDYTGKFILDLYKGFSKEHIIHVLCPWKRGLKREEQLTKEISVWRVDGKDSSIFYDDLITNKIKSVVNCYKMLRYVWRCCNEVTKCHLLDNIDIVHAHWLFPGGLIAYLLWRKHKKPYCITLHGTGLKILEKYWFLKPISRRILENSKKISVVSRKIYTLLYDIFPGIPEKVAIIQAMPYDSEEFKYIKCSQKMKERRHKNRIILTVGRLIERKGHQILLNAHSHKVFNDEPATLNIIGNGSDEYVNFLQKFISESGSVYFYRSVSDIKPFFKQATIFVLPSVDIKGVGVEGFGTVVLEAMASGVPCIVSGDCGIATYLESGVNALVVKAGDVKMLAQNMKILLEDKKLRRILIAGGLEFVKGYTMKQCGKFYEELLSE